MKLTEGGSIKEELEAIPKRNWWKYTFLVPPLLILFMGIINLFMPERESTIFLLIGSVLLLNHLAASFLKKSSHIRIAGFSGMTIGLIFLYIQFFSRV